MTNARLARRLAAFAILAAAVLFAPLFFGAADAQFTVDEPTLQAAIDRAKADLAELKTNLADGDDLLGLYIDYKTNPENYDQGSRADLKAGIAALLPARARVSSIELAVARGENKLKLMKAQKAPGSSFGDPKEAKLEDIVFSPAEKAAFAKKNARIEKADLDEIARDVWGKELTGFAKVLDKLSLTANGVPFAMIYCEPGVVALKGRRETLTQGFYLAETETTQALWEAVTGKNPSILNKGANKPVENVSRDDCRDFIAKLNALGIAPAGYKFSLPTEAQWEYAARGGKGNADRDGAEPASQYDLALGAMATGVPPVKSFPPNALGLYDMTCGVYELLQDGLAGTEYFDAEIMWAPSTGLRLALVRE